MRLKLEDASSPRLEIDLGSDDTGERRRLICLTDLAGVGGVLEKSGGPVHLRPLEARAAMLASLEWPLGAHGGQISLSSPAEVSQLYCEVFAGPLSGQANLAHLDAAALAVELPGRVRIALDAEATQLEVAHSPESVGHAGADRLELGNVQTAVAGLLVRVSGAAFDQARVNWGGSGGGAGPAGGRGVLVGAAGGRLEGVSLSGHGLTIEIDLAELPEGLITSGRQLVIPQLVVPEARVAVDDLVALLGRNKTAADEAPAPEGPGETPEPPDPDQPAAPAPAPAPGFSYAFLDRISGRLDVDLTMEISVPVIGKREATHHFRVPVAEGGIINYRELERDLAGVEDAFINLEVRGKSLVLERAIPLIPWLEKPLVVWDLDPDQLELAKKRLVHLRTIPRLRLASPRSPSEPGRNEKSSVAVRRLHFHHLDVALALAPPPDDQPDSIGRAHLGELRVGGQLEFEPQRRGAPTSLTVAASAAGAGPLELHPRGTQVSVESVEVGALVGGTIEMVGFRPRAADLVLKDVVLRNLRIALMAMTCLVLMALAAACGDPPPFDAGPRPDRRIIDAGPPGDARVGVACKNMLCQGDQYCCIDYDPDTRTQLAYCPPDGTPTSGCDTWYDCDGPEDCPRSACCADLTIECAPAGQPDCGSYRTVCHTDSDCSGGLSCCPTPTGLVMECLPGC